MIDPQEAELAGFETADADAASKLGTQAKLEQFRAIMPELVNSDGLLDTQVLKSELALASIVDVELGAGSYTPENQGYGLNFAGKGLARLKADEPTTKELKVELGQSKKFDKTENVIIRGDNLDALKILKQNYEGKVKVIYIDPPYNTDNANFIYNDSFKASEAELIEKYELDEEAVNFFDNSFGTKTHSGWLFAMYPRLKTARDLLTDDGVVFISIDDNEQANLKILCDEIFGGTNFIASVAYKNLDTIKNDAKYFSDNHEYILVFAKNKEEVDILGVERSAEQDKVYKNGDNDPRGPYLLTPLHAKSGTDDNRFEHTFSNGKKYTPPTGTFWRFSKESLLEMEVDNRIYFPAKGVPQRKTFLSEVPDRVKVTTFWDTKFAGSTRQSNKEIKDLFSSGGMFDNPKPTKLLTVLLSIVDTTDAIILDFFAGSGTTAHAVMDLNKIDGGRRKFILVQLDEDIDAKKSKPAFDFCKEHKLEPVISSICIERVNRAGEKIREEAGLLENGLDTGYKVFSLVDRPSAELHANQLQLKANRKTTEDTLCNMMAASGEVLLTDTIEEVEPDLLYKIRDSYFVLGECQQTDLTELSNRRIYIDGYAEIRLLDWLNLIGLDKELVRILY